MSKWSRAVGITCSYMMPVELLRESDHCQIDIEFEGEVTTQTLFDIDWRNVDKWRISNDQHKPNKAGRHKNRRRV